MVGCAVLIGIPLAGCVCFESLSGKEVSSRCPVVGWEMGLGGTPDGMAGLYRRLNAILC